MKNHLNFVNEIYSCIYHSKCKQRISNTRGYSWFWSGLMHGTVRRTRVTYYSRKRQLYIEIFENKTFSAAWRRQRLHRNLQKTCTNNRIFSGVWWWQLLNHRRIYKIKIMCSSSLWLCTFLRSSPLTVRLGWLFWLRGAHFQSKGEICGWVATTRRLECARRKLRGLTTTTTLCVCVA